MTSAPDAHRAIEAIWRIESARVIAGLGRLARDIGLAEDLAQDALVAALERWPAEGVPERPGAWLMATARNRAIDRLRHGQLLTVKHQELARDLGERQEAAVAELEAAADDPVGDDLLRLIFVCCHPVLSPEARVALTLKLLGGLTTVEIARAYLVPEATVAQRIVRAQRSLAAAKVPFEVPRGAELGSRLASVLAVIYLIFNEGYAATAGPEWVRPTLCEEAQRLGRVLAELMPAESEVHGLSALMQLQASRLRARRGPKGEVVLLLDQKRAGPQKVRRKAALDALQEPRGLQFESDSAQSIATPGACRLTVTVMDGQSHANHHDLLAALLMGLDVSHLTPYPAGMIRLRTSLPEFSEAVTGEKAPKAARLSEQQKVDWPPTELSDQPVVIVMDLARLAMDVEPEYERVVRRDILMAAGRYWVVERSRTDRPWRVRKHPQVVRPARPQAAIAEGHADQAELELQS